MRYPITQSIDPVRTQATLSCQLVGVLAIALVLGCNGNVQQRPQGSSLKSETTLDRVYALEDLRDAGAPAQEDLSLALKYLADESEYGLEIVGSSKRISMERVEVKYQDGIYTTDMDRAVEKKLLCDLAFQALAAHQPEAADLAVQQLASENAAAAAATRPKPGAGNNIIEPKVLRFRERLVRVILDGCRKVPDYTSPAVLDALTKAIETQPGNDIQLDALSALATMDDPAAVQWVLEKDPEIRTGMRYQNLRGNYERRMWEAVAQRPLAFLAAFEDPERPFAVEMFHVLKQQVTGGTMTGPDTQSLIDDLVARQHPQTDELLVAVLRSPRSPAFKEVVKAKLIGLPGKRASFLIKAHRECQQSGDEFSRQALEEALAGIDDPEAKNYLSGLKQGPASSP